MNWLGRLLHKSPAESELDKELRFHLEQQIADGVAKGLSPSIRRPADVKAHIHFLLSVSLFPFS